MEYYKAWVKEVIETRPWLAVERKKNFLQEAVRSEQLYDKLQLES